MNAKSSAVFWGLDYERASARSYGGLCWYGSQSVSGGGGGDDDEQASQRASEQIIML